jgi:hypothetical protein
VPVSPTSLDVAGEAAANVCLQDSSDGIQGRDPEGFEELRREVQKKVKGWNDAENTERRRRRKLCF